MNRSCRRRVAASLAVPLVIASMKMLSIGFFAGRGADAYEGDRFERAETNFDRLDVLNVVETWKAPFNVGVARFRQGDYDAAESAFRDALDRAPDRCEVRVNLVLTIEAQGDALVDADADAAHSRYAEALQVARGGSCGTPDVTTTTSPSSSGSSPDDTTGAPSPETSTGTSPDITTGEPSPETSTGTSPDITTGASSPETSAGDSNETTAQERLDEATTRIEDKLDEVPPTDTAETASSSPSSEPPPDEPEQVSQDQQDQLEESNRQAERTRREYQDYTGFEDQDRAIEDPHW